MLFPPSSVLSLYKEPEPRPVYDIPPVVSARRPLVRRVLASIRART